MTDPKLPQLRDNWPVEVPDDPEFQRRVWHRIAASGRFSPGEFLDDWLERLSTPRVAIPLAATALALTVLLASINGRQKEQAIWNQLARNYGASIDPISRVHFERSP